MNEMAAEWLKFAQADIGTARLLIKDEERENYYHVICFHAQQCVEKCLKALLIFDSQAVPKTHSMRQLVLLLSSQMRGQLADIEQDIQQLDAFYAFTRYPDALPGSLADRMPEFDDAEDALFTALEVFNRVYEIVN
jgi:HEPN domain-containing protein